MLSFSELRPTVWLLHTIWILVLVLHVPVLPVTLSRSVAIVPLTFFSILLLLFKRKYKFRWKQSCELQRSFVNDTAIQKLFPQCCQDQLDTSRVFCNFTAATRHVWVLLCHCHCKSDLKPCSCDCCCARPQRCSIRSASMVHAQYLSPTVFSNLSTLFYYHQTLRTRNIPALGAPSLAQINMRHVKRPRMIIRTPSTDGFSTPNKSIRSSLIASTLCDSIMNPGRMLRRGCLDTSRRFLSFQFCCSCANGTTSSDGNNPANFKSSSLTTPFHNSNKSCRDAARINLTRLAFCAISQPLIAMCEFLVVAATSNLVETVRLLFCTTSSVAQLVALQWSTHNICRHGFGPIFRLCFTVIKLSEHEIYLPSALCRLHKSICAMSNSLEW